MSFNSSPIGYVKTIRNNYYLISQLVLREFKTRYSGSFLGFLWSFFTPLLILAVYTFVFNSVLHSKWNEGYTSNSQFALILFAGLIVYTLFSECSVRAATLIQSHVSYVKRVVFPLEILPLVLVINSFFHACMSFAVLIIFYFIVNHSIPWTVVFVPLIILPYLIFNIGIVLFLSLIGVYIRDTAQAMGVIMTIVMFITPIFYPISALSPKLQMILYLNPLTFAVEQIRNFIIFNIGPNWIGLGLYFVFSLVIFWLGFSCFQKAKRRFADVL
jgi:lipopolysaccharide transport system permease protein